MNTDADTDDPVADTNPASDNDSTGMASDDDPHATGGDAHSTLPPPPQAPPRRLVRSDDRRLGGVAGGVAEYFDIDPVIVRLAFVIAVFAGGTGLIAYAVAWLVIPDSDGEPRRGTSRNVDRSTVLALALLAIAAAIGISDVFDDGFVTPVVLIAAGVYLLHQRPFDRAQAPSTPTTWTSAASSGQDPAGATIVAADPDTPTADRLIPTWQPGDGRPPPPPTTQPPRPEPPNRGPAVVTRFALSLISLWFAAAIAVDALDWIEGDASTVVAVALVIVGVAGIAELVGREQDGAAGVGLCPHEPQDALL